MVVAVLLAVTLLTSAGISSRSVATIEATVAENWRGAYDLLVAADGALASSAEATGGLVEQNFLALSSGLGISGEQLAAIEGMAEVEVAAPLAFVGQLESPPYGLLIGSREQDGEGSEFFAETRGFRVEAMMEVSDGVRSEQLANAEFTIVTGQAESPVPVPGQSQSGNVPLGGAIGDGIGFGSPGLSGDGEWRVSTVMPGVPALEAGLAAVDPVAEAALLSGSAGFLDDLVGFDEARRGGANPPSLAQFVDEEHSFAYWALHNNEASGAMVPVVVSESAYPRIEVETVTTVLSLAEVPATDLIEPLGLPIENAWDDILAGAPQVETLVERHDLTAGLTPFALPEVGIALPGASRAPGGSVTYRQPTLTLSLPGRAEYARAGEATAEERPADVEQHLVAAPQGFAAGGQTYRSVAPAEYSVQEEPFYAPVGSYNPEDLLDNTDGAGYVPLGLYAPGEVEVVGGEHDGARLEPSLSGRGAVLPSPGAITSLTALEELTGQSGADIVRVRVAGVEEYSPASVARIEAAAAEIIELGLDVRVVAGSSLAPVGVYLPEYFRDGDLGWTVEEWTSLGAAVQVEDARMGGTYALFALTLGGVLALGAVADRLQAPGRRRETGLLASLGWTPRRIRGWLLAERLPGMALVLIAGAYAALVALPELSWLTALAVAAYLALTAVSVREGTKSSVRDRESSTGSARPVRTSAGLAVRLAAADRGSMLMGAIGLLVVAGAAVAFTAVLAHSRGAAGLSRLAAEVDAALLAPQAALAAVALIAGALLLVLGVITALTRRAAQYRLLQLSGWTRPSIVTSATIQCACLLLPGTVIAAGGIALTAALAPAEETVLLAAAGTTAGALALILTCAWASIQAHLIARRTT